MILGIVSDTHGHVEYTRQAIRMLESLEVDQVIHCGDVGAAEIVGMFSRWPTHFVLGNVDTRPQPIRAAIEAAGQTFHGRFGELEIEERRVAFLHGDDSRLLSETIAGGRYDLVCFGHTHVAEQRRVGKTLALNPGALYRAEPHTIAIVDLAKLEATHVALGR